MPRWACSEVSCNFHKLAGWPPSTLERTFADWATDMTWPGKLNGNYLVVAVHRPPT